MNLSQQEIDRINRELGVKKNSLPQWEIDRINRELSNATIPKKEVTPTIESIIVARKINLQQSLFQNCRIYTNVNGLLSYQMGDNKLFINKEQENELRNLHQLDRNTTIYIIFYTEKNINNTNYFFENEKKYIFSTCISENGISFVATPKTVLEHKDAKCYTYVHWKNLIEVSYTARIFKDSSAMTNDPIFLDNISVEGYTFHTPQNKFNIPAIYFANYQGSISKTLNEIKSIFQNDNLSNISSSFSNDITKNSTTTSPLKRLTQDEEAFLNHLKENPNTSIDESITSLYGITLERANELKQYF